MSDVITVTDAAKQTGIPRRTLIAHIHQGRLTAAKLGAATSVWVIHQADLDAYLQQRRSVRPRA